nr:hypothetical protein [uncultured Nitrososphaera sp.]
MRQAKPGKRQQRKKQQKQEEIELNFVFKYIAKATTDEEATEKAIRRFLEDVKLIAANANTAEDIYYMSSDVIGFYKRNISAEVQEAIEDEEEERERKRPVGTRIPAKKPKFKRIKAEDFAKNNIRHIAKNMRVSDYLLERVVSAVWKKAKKKGASIMRSELEKMVAEEWQFLQQPKNKDNNYLFLGRVVGGEHAGKMCLVMAKDFPCYEVYLQGDVETVFLPTSYVVEYRKWEETEGLEPSPPGMAEDMVRQILEGVKKKWESNKDNKEKQQES